MKSAVTISLVPEARGGPFVYWDDFPAACRNAADLGFDAIEIFPASAEQLDALNVGTVLRDHGLALAAVGTGAGWVKHKLTLSSPDLKTRMKAWEFASSIKVAAAKLGAPAIIGSMQGRWDQRKDREQAIYHLVNGMSLIVIGLLNFEIPLLYEPLNRKETNIANTLAEGVELIQQVEPQAGVRLLADLYHMNLEEPDIAKAIREHGEHIGHVHLADSNRRPAGFGNTDFAPIASALRDVNYTGYISAEALPYPDSDTAAKWTMDAFNRHFRG